MHQTDRQTPPTARPITEVHLAAPELERLGNGIPVYTLHNEQLDLIHIIINIRSGILHENRKHLAHFTYSLLKESSAAHSAAEIADLMDFYGAYMVVSGMLDRTTITLSIPANNITTILPVIYDFLSNPHYTPDRLDIYKKLKIKDLEYNSRKTDVRSTQLMLHAVFGDNRTAGQFPTRENLQAITLEQMQEHHRETFCAENITLFMTGNIREEIASCVRHLFNQVPNGTPSVSIRDLELPADPASVITEAMPDSVQSSISLCLVKDGYLSADRREFSFLSTITGGYFGSRLMQNLRERNGYTYGISAGSVYFGNQALFIINSDVNATQTQAAIHACFEELQRLQEEPIGAEELESARSYMLGDMLRDVDNSVSYLKRYAFWNAFGLDEREFQRLVDSIQNINAETLENLAKKHFKHNNFKQIIVGNILNLK